MITELRTFLAVVRYGGFARAGEHIGLTQGAISGQIQRLEEQIGHVLFDRSGRRATLTPAGREVHSRAESIVSAVTELGNFANASDRSEEHTSELQSRPHLVCRLLLE